MAHQVKLADSNCALIGSSLDLASRVQAARTEEEWKGAGDHSGIQVWRVEQFHLKPVSKNEYGTFYDGDSYIVLSTVEHTDGTKSYDIHFWLGSQTSIDEMGVAAYKTVELDDLLGTLPKEHRQVQGTESDLFLSYFKSSNHGSGMRVLHGGVATGFKHVKLDEDQVEKQKDKTLWHVKGRKNVRVYQVESKCASLNRGDAFILDTNQKIYVWLGPESSPTEKYKTATIVTGMQDDRCDKAEVIHVEDLNSKVAQEFFSHLAGTVADIQPAIPDNVSLIPEESKNRRLFCVHSDPTGEISCRLVAEGDKIDRKQMKSDDVFILDNGLHVFIWVGDKSSKEEKQNAMPIAIRYVQTRGYLPNVPITRESEGLESQQLISALNGK